MEEQVYRDATELVCKHGSIEQIKTQLDFILNNTLDVHHDECKALVFEHLVDYGRLRDAFKISKTYSISCGHANNVLIQSACEFGDAELVRSLLAEPTVDPTEHHDVCLTLALSNGNLAVVKLLLEDGRIRPKTIGDDFRRSLERMQN
uniref:Ankyrin repeat domain n=1 Tax=Clandestinovirus TaxID=2831644 RepID=A0A8F8PN10_9VIRU|nr:ankyrin repeat domain [Clandestinovirus]